MALLLTAVFVFIRGSAREKIAVGVFGAVAVILLTIVLPAYTWQRLLSVFQVAGANDKALESSDERQYLLKQSVIYSLEHPIFGVGPSQFINYLGKHTTEPGRHGRWRNAHNSYTEISSECGIPALVFYLGAVMSTFGLLTKIRKKANGPVPGDQNRCVLLENCPVCLQHSYPLRELRISLRDTSHFRLGDRNVVRGEAQNSCPPTAIPELTLEHSHQPI